MSSGTYYKLSRQIFSVCTGQFQQLKQLSFSPRKYSRYAASTIMSADHHFSFSNYDCIGFDLDHTICRYKVGALVHHEYELLSKFLVEKKDYDPKYLLRPIEENYDFLQKGLILDLVNNNVVRLAPDGKVLMGSYGTTPMTEQELDDCYGTERYWKAANDYVTNPLSAWNSQLENQIRACSDFFDVMTPLCFANCVDSLISKYGKRNINHSIIEDIWDGLKEIYSREYFMQNKGYYADIKANPQKYYNKCDDVVLSWLKSLKRQNKTTFLITGSHVDFASFSADNSMGEGWRDLFDVIVFFSRKPGFFTQNRPFYGIEGITETDHVEIDLTKNKHYYSQGNWNSLTKLISHISGKNNPKIVYIGDNLIQDVYTPAKISNFDTIALCEEMSAEGVICGSLDPHPDSDLLVSEKWGSFFTIIDRNGKAVPSLWSEMIRKYAKICIPSLKSVATMPLDHVYTTFSDDKFPSLGFYPSEPINYMG